MKLLKKCKRCNTYTLMEKCPVCNQETSNPHPPRFSPEDPYGKYRRRLKKESDWYERGNN
ncbi:MAG: RNA-protein complex protein Nop10 [Candidatus Hydrothermarchaeota archaeon]